MSQKENITVLGIETSCDETAVAIVRGNGDVRAALVRSQLEQHQPYGGVVPEIAARAHLDILPRMLQAALQKANMELSDIDAIAATTGPGLIGGLLVGAGFAQSMAYALDVPLYGINHLEGHALTARLTDRARFPFLLLLVSGGHSQFLIVEDVGKYKRIGTTIDDAVGEAFDKVAKMLGFGYPGGPLVERAAQNGDGKRFALPVPMRGKDGCDFSLSGLKTAVRHAAQKLPAPLSEQDKADLAASFQEALGSMLEDRLKNAIALFRAQHPGITHRPILAVAGGVAANQFLKAKLAHGADAGGFDLVFPPQSLCGDNAVMIAWAAAERIMAGIRTDGDFTARPRWPLDSEAAKAIGSGAKA